MANYAISQKTLGVCDICGFRYKLQTLRFNSYGLRVCTTDWDGQFDRKNSPLNYPPPMPLDDPRPVFQPRPDVNTAIDFNPSDLTQQFEAIPGGSNPYVFED